MHLGRAILTERSSVTRAGPESRASNSGGHQTAEGRHLQRNARAAPTSCGLGSNGARHDAQRSTQRRSKRRARDAQDRPSERFITAVRPVLKVMSGVLQAFRSHTCSRPPQDSTRSPHHTTAPVPRRVKAGLPSLGLEGRA
jgi:hypothetical protein